MLYRIDIAFFHSCSFFKDLFELLYYHPSIHCLLPLFRRGRGECSQGILLETSVNIDTGWIGEERDLVVRVNEAAIVRLSFRFLGRATPCFSSKKTSFHVDSSRRTADKKMSNLATERRPVQLVTCLLFIRYEVPRFDMNAAYR